MTKGVPSITFAAVAQQVAARGWRPFPGMQTSKTPAMKGWSGLNLYPWDDADLTAAVSEYQPADLYCCCFAVQREIVAVDADIINPEHAAFADKLADEILGVTPLVRIGLAPKCIRIYRAGDLIKSRKLHPLEIFCGSGQFVGFGWHEKAGHPYIWSRESPLTINTDSNAIPLVTRAKLDRARATLWFARDKAGFQFLDGPGRRKTANHHRLRTNSHTSKTITITKPMASMLFMTVA